MNEEEGVEAGGSSETPKERSEEPWALTAPLSWLRDPHFPSVNRSHGRGGAVSAWH